MARVGVHHRTKESVIGGGVGEEGQEWRILVMS